MSINVLIVDDHSMFRESLRAVLQGREGIEIVGDVGTGNDALTASTRLAPDVVLLDLRLPDLNGIAVTAALVEYQAPPAVLILSTFDDRQSVAAAMRAGAMGYIVKTSPLEDLVRGILAVHAGQTLLDATASDLVRVPETATIRPPGMRGLTYREYQILQMLGTGASTGHISARLGISDKTVRNYVSSLYAKIGASNRSEAALIARAALEHHGW